jgi:hypothetical protein
MVVIDNEHHLHVLYDFAIFNCETGGRNALQAFLQEMPRRRARRSWRFWKRSSRRATRSFEL